MTFRYGRRLAAGPRRGTRISRRLSTVQVLADVSGPPLVTFSTMGMDNPTQINGDIAANKRLLGINHHHRTVRHPVLKAGLPLIGAAPNFQGAPVPSITSVVPDHRRTHQWQTGSRRQIDGQCTDARCTTDTEGEIMARVTSD